VNEKQLAKLLGHYNALEREYNQYKFVTANTALARMGFGDYWEEHFKGKPPPVRPEIDVLLYYRLWKQLLALEIKYISHTADVAYYEGLDQTLALLRLGFDYVQLWHCFASSVSDEQIQAHIEDTRALLTDMYLWLNEKSLDFPIDYAHLKVIEAEGKVTLKEIFPSYGTQPLIEYERPPDPTRFWKDNPLKDKDEPKRIREFIYHVFRLPQPSPKKNAR